MGKPGKQSQSDSTRAQTSQPSPDSGQSTVSQHQRALSQVPDDTVEYSHDQNHDTGRHDQTLLDDVAFNESELNPQTCCSNCQTIFEVSMELLASTDTRVRCGECLSIFDALTNLRDADSLDDEDLLMDTHGNVIEPGMSDSEPKDEAVATPEDDFHGVSNLPDAEAAALAGLSNDTAALDVTYSDFDLFSADAGLPEIAYFDQTREPPGFDFDELADDNDETFSDTLFAQDVTVDARSTLRHTEHHDALPDIGLNSDVDFVTDKTPPEALIFNYRERETRLPGQAATAGRLPSELGEQLVQSGTAEPLPAPVAEAAVLGNLDTDIRVPEHTTRSWLMRSILFLLVISLAGSLYFYRQRETLQHHPLIRPALEAGCRLLGCTLAEPVDLDALKVLKRTVFSHPVIDNALIINIGFLNEATFSQRYPILEIRLTDRNGTLVVKNDFQPADYLDSWQAGDVLDAGKRLDISLTVEDPGDTAASFELDFR